MSRTRMVKPGFFQSRSLSRVSRDARMTFIGLWVEADSEGRGIAHPSILRGRIWPLDPDLDDRAVAGHLHELATTGHIVVYESDAELFYAVSNWSKHQSLAYRTGDSKLPAPESCRILDPEAFGVDLPGVMPNVVQLAQPVVQLARAVVHKEKGREEKRMLIDSFDEFWSLYPKKVSKEDARKAFTKALKATALDVILDALRKQIPTWTDPQFVPYPASWLNGHRWQDEITTAKRNPGDTGWNADDAPDIFNPANWAN